VTIVAGESAVVHDGRSPIVVRLRFDHLCAGDGAIEIGAGPRAQRLIGTGAVLAQLRVGVHKYRLDCDGAPRASGVLSLKRDTGNVPLPRRPPADTIEADGRRYTVLFQTRLPALTLAWPQAPAGAADLTLHVDSAAAARAFEVTAPRHQLASGALAEGTYTWWYTVNAGKQVGKQSLKTTVTIRFDNTAPTAQFFHGARAETDAPPGTISIDGVTIQGATVTAGGKPLPVDNRGRFRAAVAPQNGDGTVAVRLESPRSGVHYYVRRPDVRDK
jgi:hypothetical protein